MWQDPIVEEIHAIREKIARECGFDLSQIMVRLRESEKQHPERLVDKHALKARRTRRDRPALAATRDAGQR